MATLRANGEILLPKSVRDELHLKAGDDFQIDIDDDDVIMLRRVRPKSKKRIIDILRACPEPLDIPARERDIPPPPIDFNAE